MRQISLLAMVAAILLTGALVVVFGGSRSAEGSKNVEALVGVRSQEDATTTTAFVLFEAFEAPDPISQDEEEELIEEALEAVEATTTTLLVTTTTVVASPQPRPSPPPTSPPTTSPPPAPPPTTAITAGYRSDYESDFHRSINQLRSSNGLSGLSRNGSLDGRARDWAKTMAQAGQIMHSNLGSLVPPWSGVAENVGKGGSSPAIFTALVNSSGHLSNMLGNYTHVGVGVWQDASGTLWVVNVFAR